jgi:hypothetical protein
MYGLLDWDQLETMRLSQGPDPAESTRLLETKPWQSSPTEWKGEIDTKNLSMTGLDKDQYRQFRSELNSLNWYREQGKLSSDDWRAAWEDLTGRYDVPTVVEGTDKVYYLDPGVNEDVYGTNIKGNFGERPGMYRRHAQTEGEGFFGQFDEAKTLAPLAASLALPGLGTAAGLGLGGTSLLTGAGTAVASGAAGNEWDDALKTGVLAGGANFLGGLPSGGETAATGATQVPTSLNPADLVSGVAPSTTASSASAVGSTNIIGQALQSASEGLAKGTGNLVNPAMAQDIITDTVMDLVADGEIDLQSLATGVGLDVVANKVTNRVYANGNEVKVPDLFKDGSTTIPRDAFRSALGDSLGMAVNGGDALDVAKAGYDYYNAGGTLGFLDPGSLSLGGLPSGSLPEIPLLNNIVDRAGQVLDEGYEYVRDDVPDIQPGNIDTPSWQQSESLSLGDLPNWQGSESVQLPNVDTPSWQQSESLSNGGLPDGWGGSESIQRPDFDMGDLLPGAVVAATTQPDRPNIPTQPMRPSGVTYHQPVNSYGTDINRPDYGAVEQRPLLDIWPQAPAMPALLDEEELRRRGVL